MPSFCGDQTPMMRPSQAWKAGPYGGKVPPEAAAKIRQMLKDGTRQIDIAKKFGISQQCVSRFKLGFRKT